MVMVRGWLICYTYESPHGDRTCVCVFVCADYRFSFLQLVGNTNISVTSGQARYIQSHYKKMH